MTLTQGALDSTPESRAGAARRGMRSTVLGIVGNAVLAVIKLVSGVLGNSYALIADSMESTLDVFGSLLVWGGLRIAGAPPDDDHPFGHGRAEPLTAMVVALTLLGAAVGLAIQSVREIITPHHPPAAFTLVVLVAVVVVKEALYRIISRVGLSIGSTAVRGDAWHHRSDAITSAAAFVGISTALLLGPGYESADDWAALLACGIIAWNGWRLFRPALDEIMDAAVPSDVEESIRGIAGKLKDVALIEKCRVRKSGLDLFVDIHVHVDGDLSVRRGHEIAHQVKDTLRAAFPRIHDVAVHIEPVK